MKATLLSSPWCLLLCAVLLLQSTIAVKSNDHALSQDMERIRSLLREHLGSLQASEERELAQMSSGVFDDLDDEDEENDPSIGASSDDEDASALLKMESSFLQEQQHRVLEDEEGEEGDEEEDDSTPQEDFGERVDLGSLDEATKKALEDLVLKGEPLPPPHPPSNRPEEDKPHKDNATIEFATQQEQEEYMESFYEDGEGIQDDDAGNQIRSLLQTTASSKDSCPRFSGSFRKTQSPTIFYPETKGFSAFASMWSFMGNWGYRLKDVGVRVDSSNNAYYAPLWVKGTFGHSLYQHSSWSDFTSRYHERKAAGYRMYLLEVFVLGSQVKYLSVYRKSSLMQKLYGYSNLNSFEAKRSQLYSEGYRLSDLATYRKGSKRWYIGAFRKTFPGPWAVRIHLTLSKLAEYFNTYKSDRRIVSLSRYPYGVGQRYLALWEGGMDNRGLWAGVDYENMLARISSWEGIATMNTIAIEPGYCHAKCCNDVVGTSYNYRITGDSTTYRWPVTSGKIRLSAVHYTNKPDFSLPFSDTKAYQTSGWRYTTKDGTAGGYHHAVDYAHPDGAFMIQAVQSGTVVFVGWDNWSGNSVVVDHGDGWRSVYMHLRNGADNDCNLSQTQTMPWLSAGKTKDDFEDHLDNSGCTSGNLDEDYWGTNSQTIEVAVNDVVSKGDDIAWAGNTGPGGKRGLGGPNTHLHIFFARLDTTNNEWYLVDPYGVYSFRDAECYPSDVLGPLTSCSRYPVAFKLDNKGKLSYA